jgi:uncharacterized membrane protein YidH (DUF202 family)
MEARVAWQTLWLDISLLAAAVVILLLSFIIDCCAGRAEWFHRSGAVVVLVAGLLGYISLTRHYRKFYNDMIRGFPLSTSDKQRTIDYLALVLSVVGTLVWGYGDKLVHWLGIE